MCKAPFTTNFLVVDDDSRVLLNVVKDIRASGFTGKVHIAHSVIEARKFMKKEKIDVFILDYHMPQVSGYELLKEIRDNIMNYKKPIIMLTSENDRDMVLDCISMGASNYLLKPWKTEDLLDRINRSWAKHKEGT